ncbi:MAG: antitoxin MazE family protein [Alphaproteobacteria bacterium]
MPSAKPKSKSRAAAASREKVRAHRERLRAQGLRPIQIWVPDTRAPRFATEASRQARLVGSSRFATEDQAFIDALSTEDA